MLQADRLTTSAALLALLALMAPATGWAADIVLHDPSGDDRGPGGYVYPTDPIYEKGSFDLRKVTISSQGDQAEIRVRLGAKIKDPWRSKEWGGNGFSLQMVFLFVDSVPGQGHTAGIPGLNVTFDPKAGWDKVVIISPQPAKRLRSEAAGKAPAMAADVVIPRITRARGKDLVATVDLADLGSAPSPTWGYQAIVQSNEGYPGKGDLLTRKVNEYEGPHRFGGGHDGDCDPHVFDMLAPPARGEDAEKGTQRAILGAHTCDAEGAGERAVLPMVVPAQR